MPLFTEIERIILVLIYTQEVMSTKITLADKNHSKSIYLTSQNVGLRRPFCFGHVLFTPFGVSNAQLL